MNTLTQEQMTEIFESLNWKPTRVELAVALNAAFALGVAQKREECAKICDLLGGDIDPNKPDETKLAANSLAHAIRKSE